MKAFTVSLVVAMTVSACARDLRFYETSGDKFYKEQKFSEAVIQYSNALAKDPQNGTVRWKLAEAFMAEGNTKAAFPQFIRAADQLSEQPEVQLKAGNLLLKGGLFKEARERARVVLQKDQDNVPALLLLGNALAGTRTLDEAVSVLERAVAIDPERAGLYTNLAVFQMAQGDTSEAEATFKRAVTAGKGSPDTLLGLANFYRATGNFAEGERTLKLALAADPKHVGANQALASLYIESDRAGEAEPYLKALLGLSPDAGPEFALADYYESMNRHDEAAKLLESVAKNDAHFIKAKLRLAMHEFMAGRRGEAHQAVDAVLKGLPRNSEALNLKARLLLADSKPNEALTVAKAAADADTKSAAPHLTLARIHVALNHVQDAKREFADTLALDPRSLPAQLELAEFHRRRSEFDTAVNYIDQAIRLYPGHLPSRLTRIRILLARNQDEDRTRAGNEIKGLLARYPDSAAVGIVAGEYYMGDKAEAVSRQIFQRVLERNPRSIEALTGLISLDLSSGRTVEARTRVDAALRDDPKAPKLLLLGAKVYGVMGQSDRSETFLIEAIKVDPSNPEPFGMLAQLYFATKRTDEAKKMFTDLARVEPRSVAAATMLGVLYYGTNDKAEAKTWWQKALAINPNAAAAANNLAWLYAESQTNLEVALQLSQIAKAQLPEEPEINDTLGWVYYQMKMSERAIEYLSRSVEKEPKNPLYQFHLGMSFAQLGEDAKARTHLTKAIEIDPKFPNAIDAKKAISQLVY